MKLLRIRWSDVLSNFFWFQWDLMVLGEFWDLNVFYRIMHFDSINGDGLDYGF